jgi:hypothetical protein
MRSGTQYNAFNHPNVATDHAQRAKALETVEAVYRETVADLFSGPEDLHHVVEMLKMRRYYRICPMRRIAEMKPQIPLQI